MIPAKKIKPKKCIICPEFFSPRTSLQRVCGVKCAIAHAKILADKKNRSNALKTKRETRKKINDNKSIPQLIKEAQVAFNAFIRFRDRNKLCICCDKPYGTNEIGGKFDCGHFRSRGSAGHLRFNEDNAFGQRKYCNTYGALNFRAGVIKRIGLERTLAIENNNATHKWNKAELIAIKELYKRKLKELQNSVD
jgi:hypothetical protein